MVTVTNFLLGLGVSLITTASLAREATPTEFQPEKAAIRDSVFLSKDEIRLSLSDDTLNLARQAVLPQQEGLPVDHGTGSPSTIDTLAAGTESSPSQKNFIHPSNFPANRQGLPRLSPSILQQQPRMTMNLSSPEPTPFFKNRRALYSSLWAFASLNYLYADIAGLMDANVLAQYQRGVVDGTRISPGFLTLAAGLMQIPIANVLLPQVIKNEKALRWVQIASGTIMTLVQTGTLFAGKPTPYYSLFSAFEIAATTYITIDAIRWKPRSAKKQASAGQ